MGTGTGTCIRTGQRRIRLELYDVRSFLGLVLEGTGTRTRIINELATNGFAPAGSDMRGGWTRRWPRPTSRSRRPRPSSPTRTSSTWRSTSRRPGSSPAAFGFIPGVGEAVDVWTLFSPSSTNFERGMAAASLTLNVFTLGFAPNFGGAAGKADDVVDGFRGASRKVDDVAASVARQCDGAFRRGHSVVHTRRVEAGRGVQGG